MKKFSMLTIRTETVCVNCRTCNRRYAMKASERHLPMSMMVYRGIPARCIAIAEPERIEWVPISEAE